MTTPPPGQFPPPPPGNYPPPGSQPSGGYYPTGGYPPPPPPGYPSTGGQPATPGYPPADGQPAPAGLPADSGPTPAVRRSGPGCLSLSLGSVALLVLVVAVVWFMIFGRTPTHAAVGDCVNATATQAIKADCGAPNASLKVRAVTQGSSYGWTCADPGNVVKFTQRIRTGRYYRYCLTLNAAQGDCFTGDLAHPTSNIHKALCTVKGSYKVTKVFDKGDANLCGTSGPDTPRLWYANPPITYCLQKTGS